MSNLTQLNQEIINCTICPRLTAWRSEVAQKKRKSYQAENYWGRPVPGFGVVKPKLLIVGLAPGAHGANRTGRIFTGDRSGDWLFRALHKAGFANQSDSINLNDGLKLIDARVLTAVRCVPPDNKPTNKERDNCQIWLQSEWKLIEENVNCIVALGGLAWTETAKMLNVAGYKSDQKLAKFKHLAQAKFSNGKKQIFVLASYHPSQQNTFTKRLTEPMFDEVFTRAKQQITNS